jgi:hypothetical protein
MQSGRTVDVTGVCNDYPDDTQKSDDYYPLTDLHYRTVALTGELGCVVEACDTDAYGRTLIFPCFAAAGRLTSPRCPYLYTGRRYDAESAVLNSTNALIVIDPGLHTTAPAATARRSAASSPAIRRDMRGDPLPPQFYEGIGSEWFTVDRTRRPRELKPAFPFQGQYVAPMPYPWIPPWDRPTVSEWQKAQTWD